MGSPNGNCVNRHHAKSMKRPYKCSICGKTYAMKWALDNHDKVCPFKKLV